MELDERKNLRGSNCMRNKRPQRSMSPPRPRHVNSPDGGWGWVIVFCSFTLQALTIGITYTFGVLMITLMKEMKSGIAETAWIGSIQPCLLYLTGIVAGPLIQTLGWRAVAITGAVTSSLGYLLSSFVTNIYLLYLTYGVLTGLGNGLMYLTSMVAVQHYFDKRRALATGLAVSGSGVGTLVFGFLTQWLIDHTGSWQNTLRIEAGIMLLGVICGAFLRPLPHSQDIEQESGSGHDSSSINSQGNSDIVVASHSAKNKVESVMESVFVSVQETSRRCCSCGCIDLSLFKSPIFVIFCLSIVFFCFGYHVPYTYTPDRAQSYGIDAQRAAFLVSIMGIANVGSRLLFGWIGDKNESVRYFMGAVCLILGGVVSCCISFFTTYTGFVIYSILFGAFSGCWASLFPVLLGDFLGVDIIDRSLGQCLATGSIAFLVASPMSGLILEKTGNYDYPYLVVGAAQTVGGLLFLLIRPIITSRDRAMYENLEDTQRSRSRNFMTESFS